MVSVTIPGLRGLAARFRYMAAQGLAEIQRDEAERTAGRLEELYQRLAPRGRGDPTHFYESLRAQSEGGQLGFSISLTTTKPDLRRWLREGTGLFGPSHQRIYPKHPGKGDRPPALGPIPMLGGKAGPFYFRSIKGMRANPWEDEAQSQAGPLVSELGARIGGRVTAHLGG